VASELDIFNLALTNLDSSQTIKSVTEQTTAAGVCRRFYDWARKTVLENAFWDFAIKTPALALVLDQNTLPIADIVYPGYRFIYRRPSDCLRFLWVTTNYGLRVNPFLAFWWRAGAMDASAGSWGPFRPPFVERIDEVETPTGQAINILTDQDAAWGVYVTDVTNVNLWSQLFCDAVAWQLATKIAGPMSANEQAKQLAVKMATQTLTTAFSVSVSQGQPDPYPDSPAITARN
jgi:hypothetical protein